QLRRELAAGLEQALNEERSERAAQLQAEVSPPKSSSLEERAFRWSIKVDRIGFLDAFEPDDLTGVEEVVIDIARDHPALLSERLEHWAGHLGRERVRLALPALTRHWEDRGLRHKIEQLRTAGWVKWEAANLSAWSY